MGRFSSTAGIVPLISKVTVNGVERRLSVDLLDKLDNHRANLTTISLVQMAAPRPFSLNATKWSSGNQSIDSRLRGDVFLEQIIFAPKLPAQSSVLRQHSHWPPFALRLGACHIQLIGFYKNGAALDASVFSLNSVRFYLDNTFTARTYHRPPVSTAITINL